MMHGSLLRLLGVGCALLTLAACADGDATSNSGFSISGNVTQGTNPTNPTNPTSESASSTGGGTTGDVSSTGASPTTGDDGTTTSPATTTATTTDATTTAVDPSTTTGVDPSTTTGDDTTGVMMTTVDETTGDPPPPPPKDPQPVAGLYEHCLDNTPCDVPPTDGCFTLTDDAMKVTDGYCTILCDSVLDCGAKPNSPAVQECLNIGPGQSVCALKCAGIKDCPTGMACINIALPNNGSGMYCF
jgi:hypothetical protein